MKRLLFLLTGMLLFLSLEAQNIYHPWQNKRVAYFGDSVTDPNVNTGTNNNHYWSFLQEWLGITPFVYAVNGRQWDDIPRQTDQLKKEHGDKFDAILIFIGTNDYNAGLPIGHWYDETTEKVYAATGAPQQLQTRKRRVPAMNNETFCGRINIALKKIKTDFPDKQVVLLTPIHRGYAYFGDNNVQPDESYQNKAGLYLESYIKAVKEAGKVWSIPVIDLANLCGLLPQYIEQSANFKNKQNDQLHPNEQGHQRIARTLMFQLLAIPCTF